MIVSSRVFENWFLCFIQRTSVTLEEVPEKIMAAVEPSKIARTLEYTISHAKYSLCLYMFRAG
jgi:hypothetical protein